METTTITIDSLARLPEAARLVIDALGLPGAHGAPDTASGNAPDTVTGSAIDSAFGSRRIVAFYGAMGAGKTTLIREIAHQLGVREPVTSPTFALVNDYLTDTGSHIYHFDFYRIDKIEEAFDLGYEEYFFGGGLCFVEWPEKITALLPADTLSVRITTHPDAPEARTIEIG